MIRIIFKFLTNIYWKIFGGIFLSLLWVIVGVIFIVTIVLYKEGICCFKVAWFVYKPFGKNVEFIPINSISTAFWMFTVGGLISVISVVAFITSIATIGGFVLSKKWEEVLFLSVFPFSVEIINY